MILNWHGNKWIGPGNKAKGYPHSHALEALTTSKLAPSSKAFAHSRRRS